MLNHFFIYFVYFYFILLFLAEMLNPVAITPSFLEVEVENGQLHRIVYASVTTDFHLPEKESEKPEIHYFCDWAQC